MQLLSCGFLISVCTIVIVGCSHQDSGDSTHDPWRGIPMLCSTEDSKNISISCHGVRIVKRVIQQLLERASNVPSLEIIDGIRLVDSIDGPTRRARTLNNPIIGFLDDRELRVRLSTLMPTNLEYFAKNNSSDVSARGQNGLNFGGGKKGGNNFLFLALMMGKMLGVIGFGALGLVSMKALMASSLALTLSLIVAAKKYASSSSSNEGGYHVVYAHEAHHEKRSADHDDMSPYRGWINNHGSVKMVTAR